VEKEAVDLVAGAEKVAGDWEREAEVVEVAG
jgi:hypothetical protein